MEDIRKMHFDFFQFDITALDPAHIQHIIDQT